MLCCACVCECWLKLKNGIQIKSEQTLTVIMAINALSFCRDNLWITGFLPSIFILLLLPFLLFVFSSPCFFWVRIVYKIFVLYLILFGKRLKKKYTILLVKFLSLATRSVHN